MAKTKRDMRGPDRQIAELIAGCPMCDFGPCKLERCFFFVRRGDDINERVCGIQAMYAKLFVVELLLSGNLERKTLLQGSSTVGLRIAESVRDCLYSLAAFEEHPSADLSTKAMIRDVRTQINEALEKFAHPVKACL